MYDSVVTDSPRFTICIFYGNSFFRFDEYVGLIATGVLLIASVINGLCAMGTTSGEYKARGVAIAGFAVSIVNVLVGGFLGFSFYSSINW